VVAPTEVDDGLAYRDPDLGSHARVGHRGRGLVGPGAAPVDQCLCVGEPARSDIAHDGEHVVEGVVGLCHRRIPGVREGEPAVDLIMPVQQQAPEVSRGVEHLHRQAVGSALCRTAS
jgi:hypothetical protein